MTFDVENGEWIEKSVDNMRYSNLQRMHANDDPKIRYAAVG